MTTIGTTEAARFLDYYLNDNVDAEFAVMLSAPWGAGKTHFIREYLDERSSRIGDGLTPCYLYASLYGVTSTSAINDQFFAELYPQLDSKVTRVIGTVAAHWLDKLIGSKNSENIVQDLLLKLKGKVLVIDDLERCSMKIADVMGFINTFVEHEGLKVVILANEADIPADQRSVYDRQKEKLIGKTIKVQSNAEEVLEKLIQRVSSKPVKDTFERERSALLTTFSASGTTNFRSLRAVLAEYERLVVAIDNRLRKVPEALKNLLLYMVATGIEFRSGSLAHEDLKNLPTSKVAASRIFTSTSKSSSEQLFERLSNRYKEVKWADPIINPKYLAELYSAGTISIDEIDKDLGRHPEVVGHANIPAWRLMWNWLQLTKSEYLAARTELLNELTEHRITHPGVILHIAGISISVSEYGDQILGKGVDPETYFKEYVATLLDRNTLVSDRNAFTLDGMGSLNMGYPSSNDPKFRAIYEIVKQAIQDVERKEMQKIADTYVSRLASDSDSYSSLFENGVHEENYGNVAFLHHIDVIEFAKLLIVDACSNDRLFASLVARFEYDLQRGAMLRDEYQWLVDLKRHLLQIADLEDAPFQDALRVRVKYYFEKIEQGIGHPAVGE